MGNLEVDETTKKTEKQNGKSRNNLNIISIITTAIVRDENENTDIEETAGKVNNHQD